MKLRILGTLLLVTIALLAPGCGKADPDAEILDRLKAQGVDLTKPQTIDFFLFFGSQPDATKAADQIRPMGFTIEIRSPRGSAPDWVCHASKTMIPEAPALRTLRQKFETIASAQSGGYDGWSIATNP